MLKQTTTFTQIDVNALTQGYKRLIVFNELDDGLGDSKSLDDVKPNHVVHKQLKELGHLKNGTSLLCQKNRQVN